MTKQKEQPRRSLIGRIVAWTGNLVLVGILVGLVMVLIGMKQVHDEYERVRDNIEQVANIEEIPKGSQATRVYARDYDPATGQGTLLASLFEQNRQQVDYYDIPPALLACLLSTEDASFFFHKGIDYRGLARAGRNILVRRGQIHGGGSTITMQLSRNVFLPYIKSEKTMNRKVQEVIFSSALEKRFTKQEILEAYCNHNFLGAQSYGVKSAARCYFDKDLSELTLSECAVIAGLFQLPTKYNPKLNPDKAQGRRDEVLRLLRNRLGTDFFNRLERADPEMFGGFTLTRAEIDAALAEEVVTVDSEDSSQMKAPYFTSYVREQLYDHFGTDQVLRQGMSIVTTLDPLYQEWAEEIIKEKIDKYRDTKRVSQAALVLIEARTGEVLACVGGYQWGYPNDQGQPDKYNRAMLGGRPVGSAMKAFTYATAYEQGFSPSMTIFDGPNKEISRRMGKSWPTNSSMDYWGWTSIATAMQYSRNAAAVDLLVNCTGIEPVIETARKMGITAKLEPVPALTLGPYDIKPVEMAEAFDTFPNMGVHVDSITLKKVYDQKGVLMEANDGAVDDRSNRAFSENTAWVTVQNMIRVVEAGTAPNARVRGVELVHGEDTVSIQVAGKTGTNDDWADAWFVGYTPELVCAVWFGNDDYNTTMRRMFGGDAPAETFAALMKRIYSCQYETLGEGETAVETLVYEPRYIQRTFAKPAGATFNGFANLVRGPGLEKDEEGNYVVKPPEDFELEGDEEDGDSDGSDGEGGSSEEDDDFYHQWQPPPEHHVYF